MKGLFIPEITAEMFRNGCLESIEALMAEGKIYDIEYSPWIPITKRPMTEDEKSYYESSCYDEAEILNCPLPEDEEDVLITVNGRTWIDTFIRDETDGCYFESYDIDEVKAWMPLPKPYKAESEE